jgi:hypothetical protein
VLTDGAGKLDDLVELIPSLGVPPLLFGMTFTQARDATRHLGMQEEISGTLNARKWSLRVRTDDLRRDIFAHFEDDGDHLTSVEVWRPVGGSLRVILRFDGMDIDMFNQSADSVLDTLRLNGHHIEITDVFFPICNDVALGFNRDGGEGNVDEDADDGLGIRFNSVLLAPAGYYG